MASLAGALVAIDEAEISGKDALRAAADTIGLLLSALALVAGGAPAVVFAGLLGFLFSLNSFLTWFGWNIW